MNILGPVHVGLASAAMVLGATVVAHRKGTRRHKLLGWAYVACMLGMNATALCVYGMFKTFGPFHWLALMSLGSVLLALMFAISKKPKGWLILHGETMGWSYVGLMGAAVAEISARMLSYPFGITVAVASGSVVAVGGTLTWIKMRAIEVRQRTAPDVDFTEPGVQSA